MNQTNNGIRDKIEEEFIIDPHNKIVKDKMNLYEHKKKIIEECKKEERERIIKLIKKNKLHLGYANNIIDEINNGNITTR